MCPVCLLNELSQSLQQIAAAEQSSLSVQADRELNVQRLFTDTDCLHNEDYDINNLQHRQPPYLCGIKRSTRTFKALHMDPFPFTNPIKVKIRTSVPLTEQKPSCSSLFRGSTVSWSLISTL